MSALTSRAWWLAAGQRAARSALVTLLVWIPALLDDVAVHAPAAASTIGLMVVASLATSLRSLPELDGTVRSWWIATLDRVVRTFFQVLAAGIPAVTLLQDVPWLVLLEQAAAAALGSLVLAMISALPESQPVTVPAADVVAHVGPDGHLITGDASDLGAGQLVDLGAPTRYLVTPPRV